MYIIKTAKVFIFIAALGFSIVSCGNKNTGDPAGIPDIPPNIPNNEQPGQDDPKPPFHELSEEDCRDIENASQMKIIDEADDECLEGECSPIATDVHRQMAVDAHLNSAMAAFTARKGTYFDEDTGAPKLIAVKQFPDGSLKYPCLIAADLAAGEVAARHVLARLHGTEACQGECRYAADESQTIMLQRAQDACAEAGYDEWETATDMYIVQQAFEEAARQSCLNRTPVILHNDMGAPRFITGIKQANGTTKFLCINGKDLAAAEIKAEQTIEEVCHVP